MTCFVACFILSLLCVRLSYTAATTAVRVLSLSRADLEVGLAIPGLRRHAAVLRARCREHPLLDAGRDHLQPVGLHCPGPGAPNGSPGLRPVAQRSSARGARGNGGGCRGGAEAWSHRRYESGRGAHGGAEQHCLEHLGLLASALPLSLSTRHAVRTSSLLQRSSGAIARAVGRGHRGSWRIEGERRWGREVHRRYERMGGW